MHKTAQRRLNHASAQTFPFYPEMTSFVFFLAVFQVNWIPTSFLVSMAVRAERMALCIRRCFSFCLGYYMHVPYKYEDKLTTLYLQAS